MAEKATDNQNCQASAPVSNKRGRDPLSPNESDQVRKYRNKSRSSSTPSITNNQSTMAQTAAGLLSNELTEKMSKMMNELIEGFRTDMNAQLTQIRYAMENGFKSVEEKMDLKLKEIKEENKKLKDRQIELEKRLETIERREKRNNNIITGLTQPI